MRLTLAVAQSLLLLVAIAVSAQSNESQKPYLKVIDAKCHELMKLGRVAPSFDCAELIGKYGWRSDKNDGSFGTYEFYQPAFDQAKRGWWGIHGTVLEGSDELWIKDNFVGAWGFSDGTSGHDPYPILFDFSVIGRTVGPMNMSYFKDGKYVSETFTATVVAIIDGGANLKLDKRAPHHAEQWRMSIRPLDYVEMCNCIMGNSNAK